MSEVRKYRWNIQITNGESDGHPVLQHLSIRTFEMETLDPPPEDRQTFVLLYDDYRSERASPTDRCVEVEVLRHKKLMTYSNGRPQPEWYTQVYARIVGKTDLPW